MAVNGIDNNSFVQAIIDKGLAEKEKRNTGEMGKDEFLNLLILQLRYQDPLNPVDDKEFIAQMAQFSTLEQMQNMNASFSSVKAFSMIGKYVYGSIKDDATGINMAVEGHVESVIMQGSKVFVVVDGKDVPLENIYNVADGFNPLASSLASYTNLLEHNVSGAVYDITTGDIVGVEGDVISLAKGVYEDYALLNNVAVTISGMNTNGTNDTNRDRLKAYLESKDAETDLANRNVELFITDANGTEVPVGALLKSYRVEADGTITAVLNNLPIPVTSVAKIRALGQSDGVAGAPLTDADNTDVNGADADVNGADAEGIDGSDGATGYSGGANSDGTTSEGLSASENPNGTPNGNISGDGSGNGGDSVSGNGSGIGASQSVAEDGEILS
ncbi:MAG: flagellar biosynthesis protein FlgD [Oscillospiraceae bacterium]|nr:flagellar biosynthesis protein FlgD [Oscillospiraceae bacterium]